jgi:Holliday junction DNA helicase RuvA
MALSLPTKTLFLAKDVRAADKMIAKLKGIVDSILEDSIILDVNGVGYQVYVSAKVRGAAVVGTEISLIIFHVFKQETQYLCGFQDDTEKSIFKALLDVHGIGFKSAMLILSTLSPREFAFAVANQDASIICRTNGIGKKTAERILLELKDKLSNKISGGDDIQNCNNVNDAILGLISLGYQKNNIVKIINEVSNKLGQTASADELIIGYLKAINSNTL